MIKLSFGNRHWSLSKFKAGVAMAILWIAVLATASYLVYLGVDSYGKARTRLEDQATSYAHLVAEHDRFGFTVADVILRDMLDSLKNDDFNGTMSAERRAQVLGYLTRHRERLPGIASFTIAGADGIRRLGVVGQDFTNLSDRGYFQALREGREFFVSNVEDGRASGKPGIHVARRYVAPDGTFGGVILVNLAAEDVFFTFYKSLNLGRNYATTLRDPHRILLSYPKPTPAVQTNPDQDVLGQELSSGRDRGSMVIVDAADGLEKLVAFERLEGTNFFATVSLPMEEAMSEARVLAAGAILAAILCLLGAMGATVAIKQNQALAKARDEAERASAGRRMLIRKLNTVVEDDRRSIAIEIHDVLNAMLVSIRLNVQGILGLTAKAQPDEFVTEVTRKAQSINEQANDIYRQCRRIVTRLRPEILDVLGLEQAIDEMVRDYDRNYPSAKFSFDSTGDMSGLDSTVSITAYRLVQEALSNVVKHAQAHSVNVSMNLDVAQRTLTIGIVDDGVGFDLAGVTAGIGVVGMTERVAFLNGKFEMKTAPNFGTEVVARIPVLVGT